jgi:hypothetical protein
MRNDRIEAGGGLLWVIAAKQDAAEVFAPATRLKRHLLVAAPFPHLFYYSCLRPSSHWQNLVVKWFTSIVPKGNLHTKLRVQIEGVIDFLRRAALIATGVPCKASP